MPELGVNVALSEVWAKGGEGGLALAEEVVRLCEKPGEFQFILTRRPVLARRSRPSPRSTAPTA